MSSFNVNNIIPSNASTVPELRTAAKEWTKENKDLSSSDLEKLVTAILREPGSLRKCMGGIVLGYMKKQRKDLDPRIYHQWLDHTSGWNEVDAICYNNFTADEMLADFKTWKELIEELSQSDNINKRRASLALLTKPVTQSDDKRLLQVSLKVIDRLKSEKEILITKAVSWLLRSLTDHHADEVSTYLKKNKDSLPKIAVRETMNKIATGRKNK